MRIERVDRRRVRIALAPCDMRALGLTYQELLFGAQSLGPLLNSLIERAQRETGFDPAGGKLFIEIYTDGEEGCVLCCTALRRPSGGMKFRLKDAGAPYLFRFADTPALLAACRAAQRVCRAPSALYDSGGLVLSVGPLGACDWRVVPLLREFGDCVGRGKLLAHVVGEHGRLLKGPDAIGTLARLS